MLTIVLASYNHEKYILTCLEHALKVINVSEIIIIDDGSTDSSIKIIQEFILENKLEKLVSLVIKQNSGLVSSLNLGLSLCKTDLIYFTASDDYLQEDGLSELAKRMIDNKSLNLIIGGAENLFADGSLTKVYNTTHNNFFRLKGDDFINAIFLRYPHPILIQSSLFRCSYLRSLKGWDVNLKLDDYSIFSKIFLDHIQKNIDIIFLPNIITCYYRHHGNNSYKKFLWLYLSVREVIIAYAPNEIHNKAIGQIAAYYIYQTIKYKEFHLFYKILKSLNLNMIYYSLLSVFNRLINFTNE
jgi:glycosyltransferase involved in cell wall biosynthesis